MVANSNKTILVKLNGFSLWVGVCLAGCSPAFAQTSAWVHPGPAGQLVYQTDDRGNRIPDFSNVGYHGGGVPLPDLPVRSSVEPSADDAGARIQAALDAVSKLPPDEHGFRGAVLLKQGRYLLAGSLYLRASGVVLRGEGQGETGTVLVATGARQRSLIVVGAREERTAADEEGGESAAPAPKSRRVITDEYVPVGAHSFHVDNAAGLQVGEEIVVKRPSTAAWIHTLGMDRIPPAKDHKVVQWQPGSKDLLFNRRITAIAGNTITVDAPLVNALDRQFGGGEVLTGQPDNTLREVGVENLRGDSEFTSASDEAHGWVFVDLTGARDAWVRRVTAIHYGYSCVYVHKACRSVTVEDCSCLDPVSKITGGRRYSFALDGQLTLVRHCYARNGRHDFVMHALAAGPNVFYDCVAEQTHADSGPHHRWSAGVLYDNVRAGEINLRNRGNMGTGHGWAGANQVVWNCQANEMRIEQPPTAQNWAIGCRAKVHSGNGYWESFDHPVQPASLYLSQLRDRLGAANASTTAPFRRD
jgi:hypothetical protein